MRALIEFIGGGECVVNKNQNERVAGFSWRHRDRASGARGWLRDCAIALTVALMAALLGFVADVHAQERTIRIGGNNRSAMVLVTIGKSQDVRTDNSFVDVTVGDPKSPTSTRSPITRCRSSARRSAPRACRSMPRTKS